MNDLEKHIQRLARSAPSAEHVRRMEALFQVPEPARGVSWWIFVPTCLACLLLGWSMPSFSSSPGALVESVDVEIREPEPVASALEPVRVALYLHQTDSIFSRPDSDPRAWYEKPTHVTILTP